MVEDVDGNLFLDFTAGIAVCSTGHAIRKSSRRSSIRRRQLLHMSGTDFYYEPQVRLAEELATIAPIQGGVRSFFGNSGTEAIESCASSCRATRPAARTSSRSSAGFTAVASARCRSRPARRPAPRLRAADAGRLSRADSGPLSVSARARRRRRAAEACLDFIEHELFDASGLARRSRSDRRRADSGGRRLRRGAGPSSCSGCRELTKKHGILLSPTKCSPAWAVPARCSRWSTPASSPT